ncbi:MAG: LuxR family transcriptional regulator [Parcubacteria group bacterium GW2011_GWA2_43_17]|nr:MAG: LuxR family transcriptional regulator [Parcubacteria group bacterium GW2011_GWA2_43_17]
MPVNIVIADDHDIIREGIKSVLSQHPRYQVRAEAASGEEALELVEKHKPDIVLLDISMSKLSGLDVIPRIKRVSPDTKIIVISVHKMGAYVLKAIRSGAHGYLNKENVAEELILALSRVESGRTYFGSSVSDYLAQMASEPNPEALFKGKLLSERETDVLRLTAEGKTAKEAARILFLSRRTVENYKNNILKKLNLQAKPKNLVF